MVLDKITNLGEGRKRKKLDSIAQLVATYEPEIRDLTDEELTAKTAEFRERFANGESLDDLMPEAFAVVREAAWRAIGQRHLDVQVMGAAALHEVVEVVRGSHFQSADMKPDVRAGDPLHGSERMIVDIERWDFC